MTNRNISAIQIQRIGNRENKYSFLSKKSESKSTSTTGNTKINYIIIF